MNKLYISQQQFDTLIDLPAVKEKFTFYTKATIKPDPDSGDEPYYSRWVRFAGVDFVAQDEDSKEGV